MSEGLSDAKPVTAAWRRSGFSRDRANEPRCVSMGIASLHHPSLLSRADTSFSQPYPKKFSSILLSSFQDSV